MTLLGVTPQRTCGLDESMVAHFQISIQNTTMDLFVFFVSFCSLLHNVISDHDIVYLPATRQFLQNGRYVTLEASQVPSK